MASTSQYNHVTSEELQKLRHFHVLDEVNEDDSKDEDSNSSDKSEELPDEELEKMLEEDLPEGFKGKPQQKEKTYTTRQKVVLEEKAINRFEALPPDWVTVRHCSGMPVYMHRGTRVCTLAKPYFLGKGNTRNHYIPLSAIPCLAYKKALEKEEKQTEIDTSITEQIQNRTWANNDQETDQSNQTTDQFNQENKRKRKMSDSADIVTNEEVEGNESQKNTKMSDSADIVTNVEVEGTESQKKNKMSDSADIVTNEEVEGTESQDDNNVTNVKDDSPSQHVDSVNDESTKDEDGPQCPINKRAHSRKPLVLPGGIVMPPPRVETVSTSWKTQQLSPEQLNDYCKKLFKFKNVNVKHFKRWADRRKFMKARKTLQFPTLPEGTKLITIPAQNQDNSGGAARRDWVLNMNMRSGGHLSVFHEYVRRVLHKQPVYEYRQTKNAQSPYQATVSIGGMQYGVGRGASKRQAKAAAARASIQILIPEMDDDQELPGDAGGEADDFSFFDCVTIEDPRVLEFCTATSEPSPHAILNTCLMRNFGVGERHINTETKKLNHQKIELTMKVGKHSTTVVCKNKKEAKQRAAQGILQALHPHIRSWGSLLRLYGSRSVKSCKEKKTEEQQVTRLQDKAQQNKPNYAVLEKLREEMRKLKQRDEAVASIGTLLVANELPTHSGSMLNNVDL